MPFSAAVAGLKMSLGYLETALGAVTTLGQQYAFPSKWVTVLIVHTAAFFHTPHSLVDMSKPVVATLQALIEAQGSECAWRIYIRSNKELCVCISHRLNSPSVSAALSGGPSRLRLRTLRSGIKYATPSLASPRSKVTG